MRVKDTTSFIKKARQVHENKYDYSKVEYKGTKEKVTIICPIHGQFTQKPTDHCSGKGCQTCGELKKGKKPIGRSEFIKRSKSIHGNNKFKYDKVKRNLKSSDNIILFCNTCKNYFPINVTSHIWNKAGCTKNCLSEKRKMGQRSNTNEFIKKARKIHNNKYDYSKVKYKKSSKNVTIICPIHADFSQTPNSHLSGKGCQRCKDSQGEKLTAKVLTANNITFTTQKRFDTCRNKKPLPFDFFIPSLNLLIEYDGEQHHNERKTGIYKGKFSTIKKNDAIKTKWAANNGYTLLRIPYTAKTESQIKAYIAPYL